MSALGLGRVKTLGRDRSVVRGDLARLDCIVRIRPVKAALPSETRY